MAKNNFEEMAENVQKMNISEEDKKTIQENLLKLRGEKINLMITGPTGCGKSSTINALFGEEVAKIGVTPNPETMDITKYELNNLIIWDTPGLGDGVAADNNHARNIINKLHEKDSNGNLLIDLVLVILDGSSKDLGTSYELINKVIIPNLGSNKDNRILVAINQADMAMKGRYWDEEKNVPEPKLVEYLKEKVQTVHKRILEATGVDIEPIYYSAGFKEEDMPQVKPYNLSKLLYFLVKFTPTEKRLAFAGTINTDKTVWQHDDEQKDYMAEAEAGFFETAKKYALKGAKFAMDYGPIIISMLPAGGVLGKISKYGTKALKILGKLMH